MSSVPSPQRVAVALFEGFTVLDVYGPVQAFASCRTVQPDGTRRPMFEIFSMASEAGKVKAGEGPATWAEWSFEKAPDYDILLIPGGFGSRKAVADQAFLERLMTSSREEQLALLKSKESFMSWQSILRGVGVYSGCTRCVDVCPVGRDYDAHLRDAQEQIPERTPEKERRLAEMARQRESGDRGPHYARSARWITGA